MFFVALNIVSKSFSHSVIQPEGFHCRSAYSDQSACKCKVYSQWVMTMSNQYYSTIRSVVVLAVTNERNLFVTKTQGDGAFHCSVEAKPLGGEEINIQCINWNGWRRGHQGKTHQIMCCSHKEDVELIQQGV